MTSLATTESVITVNTAESEGTQKEDVFSQFAETMEGWTDDIAQNAWTEVKAVNERFFLSLQNISLPGAEVFVSPFEQLEQETSLDERIRKTIQHFTQLTGVPYRQQLVKRLEFLLEVEQEENPEDWAFSLNSLYGFLHFIAAHQDVKYPDVGLSPSGSISVEWFDSEHQHIVLAFISATHAQFALFSGRTPETSPLSGTADLKKVWEIIATLYDTAWYKR